MTTTSSSPASRGLDAAPIIYSLLSGHPASTLCEGYIRGHSGWLTTSVTLLEVDAVLRKVYGVAPALVAAKLGQFTAGPITVVAVDGALAVSAMTTANSLGIDLADAVLLESCRGQGVSIIATDDEKFAHACTQLGFTAETPLDPATRQQIATWESANLPAKGLARVLFHIRHWLAQQDSKTAQEFWNQSGAGSHLP